MTIGMELENKNIIEEQLTLNSSRTSSSRLRIKELIIIVGTRKEDMKHDAHNKGTNGRYEIEICIDY